MNISPQSPLLQQIPSDTVKVKPGTVLGKQLIPVERVEFQGLVSEHGQLHLFTSGGAYPLRSISLTQRAVSLARGLVLPSTYRHFIRNNVEGCLAHFYLQQAFNRGDLKTMGGCLGYLEDLMIEPQASAHQSIITSHYITGTYLYSQLLLSQGYLSDALDVMKEMVMEVNGTAPIPEHITRYVKSLGRLCCIALNRLASNLPLIRAEFALSNLSSLARWGDAEFNEDLLDALPDSEWDFLSDNDAESEYDALSTSGESLSTQETRMEKEASIDKHLTARQK
ncbi:MAG: hypothetical protein ACR2PT_01215 [Endozoicomonas sp.]